MWNVIAECKDENSEVEVTFWGDMALAARHMNGRVVSILGCNASVSLGEVVLSVRDGFSSLVLRSSLRSG